MLWYVRELVFGKTEGSRTTTAVGRYVGDAFRFDWTGAILARCQRRRCAFVWCKLHGKHFLITQFTWEMSVSSTSKKKKQEKSLKHDRLNYTETARRGKTKIANFQLFLCHNNIPCVHVFFYGFGGVESHSENKQVKKRISFFISFYLTFFYQQIGTYV